MKELKWKFPLLYLTSVGIANMGQWIYLLAINLMVLEMTGSPMAVAALYMIKPFAHMVVGFWAGSLIDRVSTKKLMIHLDILRALLIVLIPFLDSIWVIYVLVLFIQMAGAMFDPASFTYMTLLLPEPSRKRFNALLSFVHSGAFVLGPALAGVLFIVGSLETALFVNVGTFILSAAMICLLPKRIHTDSFKDKSFEWSDVQSDWRLVWKFSKVAFPFALVYMVFQGVMLLTAALDSMEVAFAKEVLHLSDSAYGTLVSIAGIGFLVGAIATNVIVKFSSARLLMGIGTFLVAVGYVIYSLSNTFLLASIGFFMLSCFLAMANTGFMTFIQTHIPLDIMGRISSLYAMVSSAVQMLMVLVFGLTAQVLSIQEVVIGGALLMFFAACYLLIRLTKKS